MGELESMEYLWFIHTGIGIIAMQAGFMLLEVGCTESKNVKSVIMKNICDFSFGVLAWHFVGFGFFTGGNPFAAGPGSDFFVDTNEYYAYAFQQFGFASTSITIVSGAILGRSKLEQYLIFCLCMMGFIYPIVAHWVWMPNGWLKVDLGFKDFSGSGAVHMVGGCAAFVYAALLGPREGKFWRPDVTIPGEAQPPIQIRELRGHSPTLSVFGVLILYVAWFAFNGGGATFVPGTEMLAARAIYNTFLSTGVAVLSGTMYSILVLKVNDLRVCMNSFLAGLVAITGPCAFVDPYAAIVIGFLASLLSRAACIFITEKLYIDDPVDAIATHYICGLWGIIATGFFDIETGVFVTGNGKQLLAQFVGAIVITAWTGVLCFLVVYPMKRKYGLAVSKEIQKVGLDAVFFDGFAFPDQDALKDMADGSEHMKTMDEIYHLPASSTDEIEKRRLKKIQKLQKILRMPRARAQLRAALEEHHEGEGMDFLEQVGKFEKEPNPHLRTKMARVIIANFVMETAVTQVNLLSETRRILTEAFLTGANVLSHKGLFFTASEEVLRDLGDNIHVTSFINKHSLESWSEEQSRGSSDHGLGHSSQKHSITLDDIEKQASAATTASFGSEAKTAVLPEAST